MTNDMKDITVARLAVLTKIASLGLTPGQVGAMIKRANPAAVAAPAISATDKMIDRGIGLGSKILDAGKWTAILGAAGALGLGGLLGYGAEKVVGPNESDVEDVRKREQIDTLRRAASRMNAESDALKVNKDSEREYERDRRTKGRRPALQILSAV